MKFNKIKCNIMKQICEYTKKKVKNKYNEQKQINLNLMMH